MDGYLGRANNLLITTLWTAFKFIMVPISLKLATLYPREQFAVVFGLIWLSYITTDAFAEIFGSLFGKQSIKVWGVGDVNRKSVVGVVAGFAGALAVNLALIGGQRPDDRPVDRAGRRDRAVELPRRALLAARHGRFHDGDHQRAALPRLRASGAVVPAGRCQSYQAAALPPSRFTSATAMSAPVFGSTSMQLAWPMRPRLRIVWPLSFSGRDRRRRQRSPRR